MKHKYVLVDFCETLVDLQTADEFIEFLINKAEGKSYKISIIRVLRNRWINKILKRLIPQYKSPKSLILKLIKGYDKQLLEKTADDFSKSLIKNYLIQDVLNEVIELKDKGYKPVIVSGGYSIYLKYFFSDLFEMVVATDIKFNDREKCSGYFDGEDCLEENKIIKLSDVIDLNTIDYDSSFVYSDSITDIPLFTLAKNKVVVSKEKSQNWIKEQNEEYVEKVWFS